MSTASRMADEAMSRLPPPDKLSRFKTAAARDDANDDDGIGDGDSTVENEEGEEDAGFRAQSDAVMKALEDGDRSAFSRALRDAFDAHKQL